MPFTANDVAVHLFWITLNVPILLFIAACWLSWRVVNWPTFADFLIATEAELNKVSWTTRKRLYQDTIVVLVTVVLFTVFLFAVDVLWVWVLSFDPFIDGAEADIRSEPPKRTSKVPSGKSAFAVDSLAVRSPFMLSRLWWSPWPMKCLCPTRSLLGSSRRLRPPRFRCCRRPPLNLRPLPCRNHSLPPGSDTGAETPAVTAAAPTEGAAATASTWR